MYKGKLIKVMFNQFQEIENLSVVFEEEPGLLSEMICQVKLCK